MEKFFNALYNCIYNLGLITGKIIGGFFRKIAKIIKKLFHFNKASFSSAKVFFKRAIVSLVVLAIIGTTVYFASSNSNKIKAVSLEIDGEVIGYATSQTEADSAETMAIEILGDAGAKKVKNNEVRTDACNIKSASVLSDIIVEKLSEGLVAVNEIYIDGDLLCAVEDPQAARDTINQTLDLAKKVYPNSSVSFAEKITMKPTYYARNNEKLYTTTQLQTALKNKDTLTIRHSECEENIYLTDYDTVEIQTNTLFVGDTRVRRAGQNGSEYAINLVTYIDNQKVLSEHLMSVAIKEPVPQIVERGIRAESLSMGSYTVIQTTGIFCWPAVNLYTVTSPFGHRSLGYHRGIDISGANASGSLVVAGAAGTVTEAGWSTGGYGNYVIIDHGNGVETLYAHMLDNSLMVSPGDTVQKGQTIGRVGNTGYSFGAHLHFEVRVNGNRLNPAPYLGLE